MGPMLKVLWMCVEENQKCAMLNIKSKEAVLFREKSEKKIA